MDKQVHSIASDLLRVAMIQSAMRHAAELARESFYHGLGIGDIPDTELVPFAEDAWRKYTLRVTFDYPDYAHTLFVHAYQMAYQAYARELSKGLHPNVPILAEEFEALRGLAPERTNRT